MNKRKFYTAMILLLIDQMTKYLVQTLEIKCDIIGNIFSINYQTNTGAAFSIFENHSLGLLIVGIITLILVYNLSFSYKEGKLTDISFGILYGGILGNIIDRFIFAYVRDFISIGNFPVFNIADIGIVIGIIFILIIGIRTEIKKKKGELK